MTEPARSPRESAWKMSMRIMPNQLNPSGHAFGGEILSLIDKAAGVVAQLHAGTNVVTRFVDAMEFREPIYLGELVQAQARVVRVGRTSIDVKVVVEATNLTTRHRRTTNSCRLTFVALDDQGKPTPVPPLLLQTDEDRELHDAAERVHQMRMAGGA